MRLAHTSRRHRDFADRHLPVIHREMGKIVLKNRPLGGLPILGLAMGGSFADQGECGGESIATSCHDI